MKHMQINLDYVDVTNDHDSSCDGVTWSWEVRWKRIYGSYWDEFSSDSAYEDSGSWGYTTFSDDQYYEDLHQDNEWSPNVYTNGYIQIKAKVRIETDPGSWPWQNCGDSSVTYSQTITFYVSSDHHLAEATVTGGGGSSTFRFWVEL